MDDQYLLPKFKFHCEGDIQTLSEIYPSQIRRYNIPKIWAQTQGKGVTIAVLDSGIQLHDDLIKNIDVGKCRSFIDGEDIFDRDIFHGTHVSGILAACLNNYGVVGVAPQSTIVSIKVLNKNGFSQNNSVLKGLEYCLSLKPDIINMSLGGSAPMPEIQPLLKQLIKQNIVVVCSAGNNGETDKPDVVYPAQYDECIAVGSCSDSLMTDRSLFSSYGETIDFLAPGENILSTYRDNGYGVLSGSSQSAPFLSGLVALIISYYKKQNKIISVEEIRQILVQTADDIGEKGFDKDSGWGIVNPIKVFSKIDTKDFSIKESFWQKIKNIFK